MSRPDSKGMEPPNHQHLESSPDSASSPPPGRVAICSVGELFGGVERHILGLIGGLRAKGIMTVLLLFHDAELADQARKLGIKPILLRNDHRSLLATSRQLARLLKQYQVQVVHVHGYKATVYCTLARYWYPFAMVKTEHGLPELQAGGQLGSMRARLYHFMDGMATRMARPAVCYVTQELLTHHRRSHRGLRTRVIPNGVALMDQRQFTRPWEFREESFNLTIIGRLTPVKGHPLAIEAIAAPELSSKAISLYIIGEGASEESLKVFAKTQGVAHRVHFLGFRRNIYDYIAHSDALIMPSLHEGLPYTLLEAMALGIPIIASRVGGLEEVLEDGATALLVPTGDCAALAHAITRLHADPDLRRRLSENARRLQQAQYSLERMTERYLVAYREALLHF